MPDAIRSCQIPPQPVRGSVVRAIVDNHDLFWYLGYGSHDLLHYTTDGLCFVVGGNDDRQHSRRLRLATSCFVRSHGPDASPASGPAASGSERRPLSREDRSLPDPWTRIPVPTSATGSSKQS